MHALKLVSIGDAVGVVLPPEVLDRLGRGKGDSVFLCDSAWGFLLSPHEPELQVQLAAGQEFINDFRESLQALPE
jgi:hypothetical protein